MRYRLIVIFVAEAAFFSVLPVYAPPIVLQSDEIPRFLFGLAAAVVAGAALGLAAGRDRGISIVLSCALAGAIFYGVLYMRYPNMGSRLGGRWRGWLNRWTSLYTGAPALWPARCSLSLHGCSCLVFAEVAEEAEMSLLSCKPPPLGV